MRLLLTPTQLDNVLLMDARIMVILSPGTLVDFVLRSIQLIVQVNYLFFIVSKTLLGCLQRYLVPFILRCPLDAFLNNILHLRRLTEML